ncbi:polycystin-1 [Colossoma macropomum]|uniref:polycystin-1 n=1 Tax=Colossoma macropomum TaxID=42526 RepID=UPI001863E089|nr:polycystin-1 [Colossoma macropomum]
MAIVVHLLLFWILSAVTSYSDEDSCPKRSKIDQDGLHCYWISASASTWLEARDVCQRLKEGDIAVVDKPSVQDFIDNSFQLEAPAVVWLRNEIRTGEHHGFGPPISQHRNGEKGTCSQMALGLRQWRNSPCNKEHHFICGKEISVSLPSLDSYVIGVPLMSGTYTHSQLPALPSPPDLGQQRVEMMLFPGLWFSHGGQVVSLDLVSQPSQVLTMARVQILRPYCSPTHHLVPPGCSSLLNPFSCCSEEPMCNTTGVCISGLYWCHLLESCLPVTSPCSPYRSSAAGLVFPLPPRYTAVPPFYHMMADMSLKILPASEPVHFRVTFEEKGISVYPDDIVAVQHSRKAGEFLHCVSSSDSAWRQSYLSLPGPELGGWVEVGVSVPTDGGQWVDSVVCDLRLIYEDPVHVYGIPPVLSSTQSDLRIETTTPTTHLVKPQTPISGLHVLYPVLDKENQIHLPVNIQTIIIVKNHSGHNATSTWSAPVFRTGIPFQWSCPPDMSEIQAACERDTPDVWFSYVYVKLSAQGEQTLNITASNTLNAQMLSVKLQAHIPVTGLSIQPRGFHRVLVDIPQEFTAAVAAGSSVKYTWVTDNLVQFAYTGQTYNVVFKKQGEYILKVMAENPVSSQFLEVKLTADVMAPLANLTLLSKKEAITVSTPNIYTLRVKLDISIGVTIRWDFGDSSTCVNHTFSAPLERRNTSLDQTATQIYLQDSAHHTYTTPGDYTLRIEAETKYDHIKKAVPIKVRSPLTRVLISSMPTVPKVNQSILFEASSLPSSYGILYWWNFGDGSQELKGPHYKVSHAFKAAGVYNVSVCSNNTLSQMIAWMSLEVVETISGVHLSYNGPNELNLITEIYGKVSTGTSLRWTFELGDGSVFKNLSKSSISHIYKSAGNYTAQVTVSNAVSKVRQSIDVEIYQLAINGIWPSGCIVSGEEVNLQAAVTGNVSSLTFHWSFGDGTLLSVKTGTSTIAHTFSCPGNYLIDLTVYSQAGSVHYQATVCVEALITDLNLHSAQNAVAVGEEICFDALVRPSGEMYQFLWYNSSSSDSPVIGKSHHCFFFATEGMHEIMLITHNQVSRKTAKATIFVQRPVLKLSIQHEGNSDVLAVNQAYSFWTEPYQNNGVVKWDFGDGSPKKEGQNQSHAFTSAGRFHVTASVFNAVSQEFVDADVDVQVPISNLVIHTNQPYAEVGQETVFTVLCNVVDDIRYFWTVDPLFPSKLGTSEYRYVFSRAGIFEVRVMAQNFVSKMETSASIEVVERIQGVQITGQILKSMRYFPTKETITLTAFVKHGSNLTYHWLVYQDGFNTRVDDGEHFKLLTNSSGNVSVKLTVANVLGREHKDVTLRAVECVSGVNISTPAYVIAKGKPVNITVSVKTGTDLQYIWFLDSDYSPVTTDVPFVLHVFKAIGIFKLRVSVANVLGSADSTKQLTVQEHISDIDFEVDGKSHPFFITSNSLLQLHGSVRKGNVLHWDWTVALQERNVISLGNNQTVSYSFMDVGGHRVTLNVSNDISWQSVSHIVTAEDAIQDLNLRVSETVICENDAVTFMPTISQGSDVSFLLEFAGGNSSLRVLENFTISSLPVGNHTVKAIAKNHVSTLSATVAVQVVERVRGLHFCCSTVLEALKPFSFKASVITGSQVTYQWSFQLNGFNLSQETGQNVLYTPFSNGSLAVTVEASSAAFCSQSVTETVVVQWPVKKAKLINSPDGPFIDHPVTFFALADSGSDLMFQWDFGDSDDAVKITKSNTIDHKYKVKGRFVVHVTVFNNVSRVSAQLPVVVRKLECTQPRVSLIQDQPNILKATPNYFEASVELNGCVSYKTTYLWEIFHDPNCTEKKVSLDSSVDVATPLLSLPKKILEVGDYCLKFSARFQGTPLHHHKTTKISVVYSPLVPIIKGGSHRMWSSQNDLILDGTESYDPDSAAHDDLLQFQWDFKVLQDSTTSHSSGPFFPNQIIQHNRSSLILPSHILEPGSVYQFTLTVQKDGRPSVSTKQYVKMYEEEVIPVAVKCVSCSLHSSSYVSHSHPVALAGHCSLCNGTVKFKWTAENLVGDVLHLNEVTTSTGDGAPILVVRPDVLMAGSEYIFTLSVSQSITGLWGSASIALKLNHPPQGGSCTLSPEDSVQLLQDMVSFSCSGWLDEDRESAQMIYSLRVAQCEDPGPQCPLITLYRGTQHTFRTLVPLGSARMRDNASIITIIVQVEDNMGAKVTALRRNLVVVLPVNDQGTTEWLKRKSQSELPALLQQGNPQNVIQYSTALISQLNQVGHDTAMSGQDFEDRVQMRGNVTQALASLSVSSLQDAAQISSALAHSTAVPSELQCGDCHSRVVETTQKMIKVIREQTKQGDVTPVDTGRNILNVLSNSMTAVQKSKDILGANFHYKHQDISETAVSALQQVGELMRSLMWSRMPGEEALSLKAPQISAVGIRDDPASNLLCTEESSHCQFHIPPALSSQLSKEREEVLQVLLVMETEGHPFVSAADPPISTTLAAMEFATPQGQPIAIANLTSDSAIQVTLHKQDMDVSPRVNITLPSKGSVNFTVKAVEMDSNAGLFIALNFSLIQGSGQINSGRVNVSVSDQRGFPLSQHSLNLSLCTDIPSVEDTIFLTPLLNSSSKELYVTLNSSMSDAEVCVSVCVFSSLCQFFNVEQRRWSTDGLNVLSSSSPNTADCLTQHLTLFGASLFVHPDAILLLPPSDGPVRNVVVGIVCGVLLLIHLLVGLIAHKLDHLESLRLSCIPLCGQAGRYHYRVLVKTGWQRGAGTSAHVGISLYGLNKSGSRHLQKEGAFQRNGLDDFQVETDANLGEIWKICIWHDNTGLDPSWYLQHVVVWDMQMDNMFFFVVEDWLSVENEKNSGMVQKVVLATCPQELQQFGRMVRAQLLFGLREHHLWLSLWERPAHSSFSRAQRVTSCALLLHLYLAAGAVWYGAVSTKSGRGPVADQMLTNTETILIGMTVAVVMFPLQSLLTSLFSLTKSKVVMELSLPPSPVSDTVEMDVYLSHTNFSCSSFLSMPGGPESSTYERPSPFTESLGSLKLQSEFLGTSNMENESVDQWTSNDSIFGLPELMGPTRLLKRKRALLQLQLVTPTSNIANLEPSSSPHVRKQPPSLSEEELRSASADPFLPSTASSGLTTSDSGRYSPNETSLSDSQDRSCSEWSELNEQKPMYEGGLYKSPSSVSVCSVASTFLPSLPPDSCSIVSNTRIGVARGEPGVMLPSWVLAVVYLLVAVLLGTCLSIVGLYGSKFTSSVVLMWLTSALSAFLTSALLLEPLKICVRALYLSAVVKPVDPEVEDRLAQETVVRRMVEEPGTKVHPPCGYGLLQAKEEARKVRMVQALMRNCLVYMMFLLVVLMVNYQDNIQEMNSRLLQSAVKRSIISASSGQPKLTALSGWMEAWQWMNQSLITHLHQNVSFSLIGPSRLKRVQSKNFCGGNTEDQSSEMFTTSVLSHSNSQHPRRKTQSNNTASLLPWSWSKAQSCMFSQTEEILLGNSSVSTSHILSGLQTACWITAETQAVLVEFTQYHRETGLFMPVSVLLENTQAHRILSTISIQSFHIPGSHSGLDFNIALTALLLLFSVCILSAELWAMLREGVQYLRQGWHLLQLLLTLLSLATASLRLCFLSKANACLSRHLSQPDAFTDFHSAALLAKRSSQLSAVLLTLLVLQMVGALRFVRKWVVFGRVLQQAGSEMCGVFLLFTLLLLLFSHTGCVLFSGSVEGFRTMWQTNQSLLSLLRGRRVLHQLCERHPVLGPLYCLSVFGVGFWLLGRLCGAVLVHTYRSLQAEMYRPSMEPQDYEMVEFLIKRLKLWMGLSKAKEFRHRVKFEGMESPPSRSSRCSQFSSLSVANSPISPSIPSSPSSPAGPRLISSASSLASECSTLSDSPDLQQYLDRLLPSVDSLLAGFDRVNQLTDDVLNIELQLQKASCRIAKKRKKHKDPQPSQTSQNLKSEVPQPDQPPQHVELKPPLSSQQGIPQILPRRRGTHSESSITGPVTHVTAHPGNQAWQQGQTGAELDIRNFPRRRAWNSGSCHSADPIQRSPKTQNPAAIPVRPRSEEGDRSEVSKGVPVKRRAWHPEDSEMEKD